MAKVKEYDGNDRVQCVIEDPRPGVSALYFYGKEVDKNTLSPKYEGTINFSNLGNTSGADSFYNWSMPGGYARPATYANMRYSNGVFLSLSKGTTSVPGYMSSRPTNGTRQSAFYLDWAPTAWLDDTIQWSSNSLNLTDNSTGTTEKGVALIQHAGTPAAAYMKVWTGLSDSTKLHEQRPANSDILSPNVHRFFVLPKLSDNNYAVLGWGMTAQGSQYDYPSDEWKCLYDYRSQHTSFRTVGVSTGYIGNYWTVQFLGYSTVTNDPIFIGNNNQNRLTPYFNICRLNHVTTTTPNVTQLNSFTGNGTIGGTNAGGNSSITYRNMRASHWYDDPRVGAGTKKVFYRPWFDSYNNFHPVVVTWDQTTDTFAREDDVTITGDLSSVHSNISGISDESATPTCAADNYTLNETFVSGGVRYITVMHFQYQDCLDEGSRTWVTYSIDSANPKAFTYHSSVTIPITPMNIHWLNDSRTLMAVLTGGNTYIYAFNASTGWSLASTITDKIVEIGRDSLDRIWYVTQSDVDTHFTSIHLLTPSLPVTVTIEPASTDYTYAGSPINTTLALNAINASGARISTNIKVVIEGASMTFSDGTTVKTISTSSTADTIANIIITGAGYSNVTASIEI